MARLSALVVEDQTIMCDMLVELLSADPRFVAVASCGSAEEGVARVTALAPDLLVLDLMLPDGNGLEVLAEVRRTHPRCRVIVLTAQQRPEVVRAALRGGAHGLVMKGTPLRELRSAVDHVLDNGMFHCPATAELVHRLVESPTQDDPLTARQLQILQRVAAGASTKEIAAQLDLSEKTVSNHRSAIMRRLNIYDIAGLTRYALSRGLVEL